jgi:hypothetical protein
MGRARGDVELAEHLAEVVGDGVLADEQPCAGLNAQQFRELRASLNALAHSVNAASRDGSSAKSV